MGGSRRCRSARDRGQNRQSGRDPAPASVRYGRRCPARPVKSGVGSKEKEPNVLNCGRTPVDHWMVADRLVESALERRHPGRIHGSLRSAHPLSISVPAITHRSGEPARPIPIFGGALPISTGRPWPRRRPLQITGAGGLAGAHTRNDHPPSAPTTLDVHRPRFRPCPAVPADPCLDEHIGENQNRFSAGQRGACGQQFGGLPLDHALGRHAGFR